VPNGSNGRVFASGKLPIYVNAGSNTTPTFYLARITPTAANRTLHLEFYDIGDVGSGSVNLQVVPPIGLRAVDVLELHVPAGRLDLDDLEHVHVHGQSNSRRNSAQHLGSAAARGLA
jgi:hypothetical protein